MLRLTDLTHHKIKKLGRNVVFNSSWIEYENSLENIEVGYGVKFSHAQISIHSGGKLFINDLCEIRGRIIIGANCEVRIGYGLICNDSVSIHANDNCSITIGDDCLFANARIYSSDMHSIFNDENGDRINHSKNVSIGNKVWISRDALILKGTRINNNCIVGARSVLSGEYLASSMIAGSPGKVIKKGISWSRNLVDKKSEILSLDFPIYRFRSAAMQYKHDEVISIAINAWSKRNQITSEDYYVIYYLSRALLLKYFRQDSSAQLNIDNHEINLKEIFMALLQSFEVSGRKNFPCGSYAYLSALMLQDSQSAKYLHDLIQPFYKEIDSAQFNI